MNTKSYEDEFPILSENGMPVDIFKDDLFIIRKKHLPKDSESESETESEEECRDVDWKFIKTQTIISSIIALLWFW